MAIERQGFSNIKHQLEKRSQNEVLGYFSTGAAIRHPSGEAEILRPPGMRDNPADIHPEAYTKEDFIFLPFHLPENPQQVLPAETTLRLAKTILKEFHQGDLSNNTVGIEVEGNLYNRNGRAALDLIPKYDGVKYRADNDLHPEKIDSMIEVASDHTAEGVHPSSAAEISRSLAEAIKEGIMIAADRKGLYVPASVPEGGLPSQIKLTEHPYIKNSHERGISARMAIKNAVPADTIAVWEKRGVSYEDILTSGNATHVHTSIPLLPDTRLFDPRTAYALGILRHTQIAKVAHFALYNTKHLVGEELRLQDGTVAKDVRTITRRAFPGSHDATIPQTAYEYFENAIKQTTEGNIHSPSRYPRAGQHDRLRIKEFGTCEAIDAPANPDLRLTLSLAYANQLLNVSAYHALIHTHGDESKVLAYLSSQSEYGNLFQLIPTLKGKNSSFKQDLLFHKHGFAGKVNGVSFADQLTQGSILATQIGEEIPGLKTQATIVSHVFGKVTELPRSDINLSQYMGIGSGDYHPHPLYGGIVTDYKSPDITENIRIQAEATKKQAEALLTVRDDQDLLEFFGIQ